ncbi:MAG: DegT/DnrJ/EryC1/StrS family aminotransferase [Bacteroidota bacterium]
MIQKEAKNRSNFKENKFFTKSARNAFLHILRLQQKEGKTLLIPSYIGINDYEGSGVFDVIQISRIPYQFYDLSKNLSPILNSITLEPSKSYCFLLIHYFGFPADNFEEVIKFCSNSNTTLVEDCAHALHGLHNGKKLGLFGDFAFHSIHKILPTDDGGILVDNTQKINFQILPENEGIKQETLSTFALSQHSEIAKQRRGNYFQYLSELKINGLLELMQPTMHDGIVPLNFPIIVHNGLREKLYFDLIAKEITTSALYYRMIPQINQEKFPLSYNISSSILNLPVHQDTTAEQISFICSTINELLKLYAA